MTPGLPWMDPLKPARSYMAVHTLHRLLLSRSRLKIVTCHSSVLCGIFWLELNQGVQSTGTYRSTVA